MGCIYGFRKVPSINHYFLQQPYVANHFNGTRVFYMNWELEFFLPFFVVKEKRKPSRLPSCLSVCVWSSPTFAYYAPDSKHFNYLQSARIKKKIAADPQTSDIGVTPATFPVSPKTMSGNVPWKQMLLLSVKYLCHMRSVFFNFWFASNSSWIIS